MIKKLKWLRFFLIMFFYVIPRIFYVIKFVLPKQPEDKNGYDKYAKIAEECKDLTI